MYLTHTFAHREALSRAHGWLTRLGFHPLEVHAPQSSIPRLMIPVGPDRLAAAHMLINVAESADPDGFPSFWDKTEAPPGTASEHRGDIDSGRPRSPQSSVIGWHPLD
jgi:hypothetical protein